jgi:voltage-gated potassium channel
LVALLAVLNRTSTRTLRGRVVTYVVGGTLLLVLVGALAVTDAERGAPGANIAGFGDGLWWAVTTMTTVGYGDRFPVTTTGRFVAVALMVGGIALLGVVTATLASWLVDRVAAENDAEQAATRTQVEALALQVDELRVHLKARTNDPEHQWSPPEWCTGGSVIVSS